MDHDSSLSVDLCQMLMKPAKPKGELRSVAKYHRTDDREAALANARKQTPALLGVKGGEIVTEQRARRGRRFHLFTETCRECTCFVRLFV